MMNSLSNQIKPATIHPLWLRICHWVNALSILIMVTSGWRIYNASPLFNFDIPDVLTLGGWLAGALQWHFSAILVPHQQQQRAVYSHTAGRYLAG